MFIALIGTDGAGKSTQTKMLSSWLIENGKKVVQLDKWDILESKRYPECRFIHKDLNQLRECISEMDGPARALFLFWSIDITLKPLRDRDPSTVYISDGYWIKHAASEILYGQNKSWIENIVHKLPVPDMTFYFSVDISTSSERKIDFTPYECGRDKPANKYNFLIHQKALKAVMDEWSIKSNWLVIDANQRCDEIQESLRSHIKIKME